MLDIYSLLKVLLMEYPKFKNKDYIGLNGTSELQLLHPHFEKWQDWFIKFYKPPKNKIALIIPCAAIKPYYNSPIHKLFNNSLKKYEDNLHKVVISNAGVIPYEFSDKYPFNSYDWNPLAESELIKEKYVEVSRNRIYNYLKKHPYRGYISYLRQDSLSFRSLNEACRNLNLELTHDSLNQDINSNKDSDLVLIYPGNLKILNKMIEDTL